jgi:hypothetical protein
VITVFMIAISFLTVCCFSLLETACATRVRGAPIKARPASRDC